MAGSRRAAVVDRDHRLPHRRGAVPDRRRPPGDVVVVAVGSHEPDAREVDAPLLGWATVVVEDVGTALREAGDVVLAIAEGRLTADDLVPMRDVVTSTVTPPADRPLVLKSVGMSWQDLVVAEAVLTGSAVDR